MSVKQAFLSRYSLQHQLGRGASGVVFLAKDTLLGRFCAIKVIRVERKESQHLREAELMSQVDSTHIVKLYDQLYDEEDRQFYLAMEYCGGGSLESYWESKQITEQQIWRIILSLLSALYSLHSCSIIHRDVKPANVLVCEEDGNRIYKLSDLGVSRHLPLRQMATSFEGTPLYMAPEIFFKPYTRRVDIWSVGVLAYKLKSNHYPFEAENMTSLVLKLKKGTFKTLSNASLELNQFIRECLQPQSKRKTVSGLVQSCKYLSVKMQQMKIRIPIIESPSFKTQSQRQLHRISSHKEIPATNKSKSHKKSIEPNCNKASKSRETQRMKTQGQLPEEGGQQHSALRKCSSKDKVRPIERLQPTKPSIPMSSNRCIRHPVERPPTGPGSRKKTAHSPKRGKQSSVLSPLKKKGSKKSIQISRYSNSTIDFDRSVHADQETIQLSRWAIPQKVASQSNNKSPLQLAKDRHTRSAMEDSPMENSRHKTDCDEMQSNTVLHENQYGLVRRKINIWQSKGQHSPSKMTAQCEVIQLSTQHEKIEPKKVESQVDQEDGPIDDEDAPLSGDVQDQQSQDQRPSNIAREKQLHIQMAEVEAKMAALRVKYPNILSQDKRPTDNPRQLMAYSEYLNLKSNLALLKKAIKVTA